VNDFYQFLEFTLTLPKIITTVNNIPVKIIKPKFILDCFTLVIRYVPHELDSEFVKEEIKRTIASADNIKQTYYVYERTSNDFCFTVIDLTEYNTARELVCISIGSQWLPITSYEILYSAFENRSNARTM